MNQSEHYYIWLDKKDENKEIPAWKSLENALKQMAVLSQHEKVQSDYVKMKEFYQ